MISGKRTISWENMTLFWIHHHNNMVMTKKNKESKRKYCSLSTAFSRVSTLKLTRWSCVLAPPTSRTCWSRTLPSTRSSSSRTSPLLTLLLSWSSCMLERWMLWLIMVGCAVCTKSYHDSRPLGERCSRAAASLSEDCWEVEDQGVSWGHPGRREWVENQQKCFEQDFRETGVQSCVVFNFSS